MGPKNKIKNRSNFPVNTFIKTNTSIIYENFYFSY